MIVENPHISLQPVAGDKLSLNREFETDSPVQAFP
jgi:hypothetical protein